MCDEKHILWTRPRPPKSILHISIWPRREDLWLKVFEGNLLKMFPFQVQTCLQLQRVDLIKRKVIIRSVQWQYRWRLSYIMEVIVTSAVQYSTVQYSTAASPSQLTPGQPRCPPVHSTCPLLQWCLESTVQHSTVQYRYCTARPPPRAQPRSHPAGAGVQHSSSVTLTTHYFYPGKYNKGSWGLAQDIAGLAEADWGHIWVVEAAVLGVQCTALAVLCCTVLYWAVLGCTVLYWAVLGCTGLYLAVLGLTGSDWELYCICLTHSLTH